MSVAFNGMENQVVTFRAETGEAGDVVAMEYNDQVKTASEGTAPVGILLNKRCNYGAVQIKGFVQVAYSGATPPSLGWNSFVADGKGGMRLAASGETGRPCLVVNLNSYSKMMGLFL
ncbi:MAG: hypothetical protein IKU62_08210 [Ruminiclostridium sp.]|nr:hypothetical protein [Ruminiclostridium sp.]